MRIQSLSPKYEIYFWCAAVSPHHLPLYGAALAHPRISRAFYIAQASNEPLRQALGWENDVPEGGAVIVAPAAAEVDDIVRTSSANSIHIFYGMRWVPCIVSGLAACIKHGRRFGIFHEPRVLEGPKGIARLAHSWLTESALRRHADFILAIGAHGPSWFRLSGYGQEKIFPAAYFLDLATPDRSSALSGNRHQPPKVGFVGRVERVKGFHLLLEAIKHIRHDVQIVVAGTGSMVADIKSKTPPDRRPEYRGVVSMRTIPELMGELDILVLPSITKDDGWGAVVGEALAAGAAVITSDRVGASICLDDEQRGEVVVSNDALHLAAAIDHIIDRNILTAEHRKARSEWAITRLDCVSGINYIICIFDHLYHNGPRPKHFLGSDEVASIG